MARRTYHHGDLRQALVDATVAIATEEGLDSITMRSVSARAGVSEAAPYHHFANKADLLAAAAALAFRNLDVAIEAAIESARSEGRDPAVGAADGYISFSLANQGQYDLIFGRHIVELSIDQRDEVRASGRSTIEAAIAAIDESLSTRKASVAAEEVFPLFRAILHGIVGLVREKELGPDTTVDEALELSRRGVAALLDGVSRMESP